MIESNNIESLRSKIKRNIDLAMLINQLIKEGYFETHQIKEVKYRLSKIVQR